MLPDNQDRGSPHSSWILIAGHLNEEREYCINTHLSGRDIFNTIAACATGVCVQVCEYGQEV